MRKNKILLFIFISLGLLFCSCEKQQQVNYGVSITAPVSIENKSEVFSEENINTLRVLNAFNFTLLSEQVKDSDSLYSFCFSALNILPEICNSNICEDFISSFGERYGINDKEKFLKNINEINAVIFSKDSTIKITTSSSEDKKKSKILGQKVLIPIINEGLLKSSNNAIYNLSGDFGFYDDDKLSACDIFVGNDNYSFLIIEPKTEDIRLFISSFSEEVYKNITDKLEYKIRKVSIPSLDFINNYSLHLPFVQGEDAKKISLLFNSEIKIIKPTPAKLQQKKQNIDDKIITSKSKDKSIYNKPFLFILREKSTNAVLAIGLYSK